MDLISLVPWVALLVALAYGIYKTVQCTHLTRMLLAIDPAVDPETWNDMSPEEFGATAIIFLNLIWKNQHARAAIEAAVKKWFEED